MWFGAVDRVGPVGYALLVGVLIAHMQFLGGHGEVHVTSGELIGGVAVALC